MSYKKQSWPTKRVVVSLHEYANPYHLCVAFLAVWMLLDGHGHKSQMLLLWERDKLYLHSSKNAQRRESSKQLRYWKCSEQVTQVRDINPVIELPSADSCVPETQFLLQCQQLPEISVDMGEDMAVQKKPHVPPRASRGSLSAYGMLLDKALVGKKLFKAAPPLPACFFCGRLFSEVLGI